MKKESNVKADNVIRPKAPPSPPKKALGKGFSELSEKEQNVERDRMKRALFENVQAQANEIGQEIISRMVLSKAIEMVREAGYTVSKH